MKVFKFGGASVNSTTAVKNVKSILERYAEQQLVLVFSAMGKTTNALEKITTAAYGNHPDTGILLDDLKSYHLEIAGGLFPDPHHPVYGQIQEIFNRIQSLTKETNCPFDEFYDRIVPSGELLSTTIVSNYLRESGLDPWLVPACDIIVTDPRFRDAAINWSETEKRITEKVAAPILSGEKKIIITQGFIGATADGRMTTLGREGSDFTASILAFCLNAGEVIVWKDVDGLLNGDPAIFQNLVKIDHISYYDAIELAFFGAKILHPKTIKPLQNKSIPLRIKSFFHPESGGTLINNQSPGEMDVPFLIKKQNQVLISFVSKDFSFIAEDKLHLLFGIFNQLNIKVNLMQNSAISFSIIINHPGHKLEELLGILRNDFDIRYNEGLELLTIRNFNEPELNSLIAGKKVLLEQRSRRTIQLAYLS